MNGFILHNLGSRGLRVVSTETNERAQGWDEISAVVEGAMSETALRAIYRPGMKLTVSGSPYGFYLEEPEFSPGGPGISRVNLRLRGLFSRKIWGEPGVALAIRQVEDLSVRHGSVNYVVPKASVLDATPTFRARVFDDAPPPYAQVGTTVTAPVNGLSFPVAPGTNKWSPIAPKTYADLTANVPSGWVLTDVQAETVMGLNASIQGSSDKLFGKDLTYTLFWPYIP